MKRFGLLLLTSVALLALNACSKSDPDYKGYMVAFADVEQGAEGYYFVLDSGETVYPGDVSQVPDYKPSTGDRIYMSFFMLLDDRDGYTYNGRIAKIITINRSEAEIIFDANRWAALPYDKIDISGAVLNRKYATFAVTYTAQYTARDGKHKYYLAYNGVGDSNPSNDQYLTFELRHDAAGDTTGELQGDYISFRLDSNAQLASMLSNKRGIRIKVNAIQYQEEVTMDFPSL